MFHSPFLRRALAAFLMAPAGLGTAAELTAPIVNDPRLELTLVAAAPDIVTPIGLAIDRHARLYVIESHTHFPKSDYPGPKSDRVKIFSDTNSDGKADKISVFAEGFHHAMNLAFALDGSLYLVHRNGVIRLEDQDGDGAAESRKTILDMKTPGNYPHNGLGGIAFSPDGWLYVGQGENLGERYTLQGTDGRSVSGREGGNVFRCRPDGTELEAFATGFWNPFGLAFYGKQFLLAVDNDPDSRPPNRLLDVVKFGDYGFKFRFGRNGLHPYLAWNGELPGTLPMIAGTGEAACTILTCDQTSLPSRFRESVLVTAAWDHQIEAFRPRPFGASLRADREVLVQGGGDFRPVGLAAAPDGSVYFTDWVDVSYNVHGQGRIWKLSPKPGEPATPGGPVTLTLDPARLKMNHLLAARSLRELPALLDGLNSEDAFVCSAAVGALSQPIFRRVMEGELGNRSAAIRLGALLALRRAGLTNATAPVSKLLSDPDEKVRLMALIWAGEQQMTPLVDRLALALHAGPASADLLRTHAATAQILAKASQSDTNDIAGDGTVFVFALAEKPDDRPFIETLQTPPGRTTSAARLTAVRGLMQTTNEQAIQLLRTLSREATAETELRCEAIVALGADSADRALLLDLLDDPQPEVRREAARALSNLAADSVVQKAIQKKLASQPDMDHALEESLRLVLARSAATHSTGRPTSDDAWRSALAAPGDVSSGRRVFFSAATGCARCHRIEDFGNRLGPDLSTVALGADREKLIQSILHPSRDIAPQFVAHTIETKDGPEFTGLLVGQSVTDGVTLFLADGRAVLIPPVQNASQTQSKVSLMPEDLATTMTVQDFRDLLSFLLSRR